MMYPIEGYDDFPGVPPNPKKYWFQADDTGIVYDTAEGAAEFLKERPDLLPTYIDSVMGQIRVLFSWRDFITARELFELVIAVQKLVSDTRYLDRE
jgi:hypothetical protein